MELSLVLIALGAVSCVLVFALWGYYAERKRAFRAQQDAIDAIRAHIDNESLAELVRGINERDRRP